MVMTAPDGRRPVSEKKTCADPADPPETPSPSGPAPHPLRGTEEGSGPATEGTGQPDVYTR
ncbi:hypothetical protein GCM10009549_40440 [Streptomyces thermoalcalitolerans]|uniref:Uncharacterized protein n=1 Tax=Streptomyces thermoalcalitolerans TaxID=65605 RepID=A0ABN1P3E7_9ACTN